MATNENLIPIPGRLHSVASDEIVSGANEIYDDKLSNNQENLNTGFTNDIDTIYNTIGDNNEKGAIMEQLNTIDGRLDTIDGEISALNHIPIEVVQLNPSTGEPNVSNPEGNILYRASNSDQTSYSDWMYKEDDHEWVKIFEQQTPSEQEKLVGYYTCNTTADQSEKSVGDTEYVLPINGGAMKIKMTNANTADNATLKIGSETAKPLWYNDERASSSNTWEEGEVISVYYDGANYKASNAMGGGSAVGKKKLTLIPGYIENNGDTLGSIHTTSADRTNYRYIKYPAKEGDVVQISGTGASGARLWGIVGEEDVMLDAAATNLSAKDLIVVMPEGTAFITINSKTNSNPEWYYAKAGSVGAHEMLTEAYLYGDLRTLAIGQVYSENEIVKTSDKQLLRVTKKVSAMNITDEVAVGDLKVYGGNTYLAQKKVKSYNDKTQYSDGDYALGAPAKLSLSVVREQNGGDITVTIGSNTFTVTTTDEDEIQNIVSKVAEGLSGIENVGWAFNVAENTIVATCDENGDNSDTLFSIVGGAGTGVTGTVEITSAGTADSEEGAGDGTPTVLTMSISLGVGSVVVTVGSITNTIAVNDSDTASSIASNITAAEWEGWNLSVDSEDVTKIIAISDNAEVVIGVPSISENIFGISGTGVIEFSGSTKICKYDESVGWNEITLNQYVSDDGENAIWQILNVSELISYATKQNSINQELNNIINEIIKDEHVLAKKAADIDRDINLLQQDKSSKEDIIDNEYVIAKALLKVLDGGSSGGSSGDSGVLSCANSDIINVLGSSYTDGGHVLPGKNWVHRISELSDYQYNNDGVSGTSYYSQLNGNYQANSIRYKGYCLGKYVILNNNENKGDISYSEWFKSLDNMVRVCTGLGIEPILATNWSQSSFQNVSAMYEDYARTHNLIYMNGNDYSKSLKKALDYPPFSSGTHLGTRCQGVFSDAYLPFLQRLERPMKSMKIFRLRASYNTSDLDSLMFTDNEDRLRYFREIWCGSKGCAQNKVDNYPDVYPHTGGDGCPNQYAMLREGNELSFTKAALISSVIPYTGKTITSLKFNVTIKGDVTVYVKNVLAKPYAETSSYTRFNIANEIETLPQIGSTYSDGITVFTVANVILGENGSFCTIYMNGWTNGDEEGTLVKQSGVGSDTIPYNMREIYSEGAIAGDTCGHWVKIEKEGFNYDLSRIANKVLDYDKLNILIVGESFTIREPRVLYSGQYQKFIHREKYTFVSNNDNPNTELITEPTFGNVGTLLTSWVDSNGNALTSQANYGALHPIKNGAVYEIDMPNNLNSILRVDNNNSINTTISSTVTNVMLEIYARYFAPVYTDGSGNQITYESYDYEDLFVQIGSDISTCAVIKKQVGLMWKIVQIPIKRMSAGKIKIYGGPKGVEIAKVSLKKIQNYETY